MADAAFCVLPRQTATTAGQYSNRQQQQDAAQHSQQCWTQCRNHPWGNTAQLTTILRTFAVPTTPLPLLYRTRPAQRLRRHTDGVLPVGIGLGNANDPLPVTVASCAPLFSDSTSPTPARPLTVPPTVKVLFTRGHGDTGNAAAAGRTGAIGHGAGLRRRRRVRLHRHCVVGPARDRCRNAKLPLPLTATVCAPLFSDSTKPEPVNPLTVPPMVPPGSRTTFCVACGAASSWRCPPDWPQADTFRRSASSRWCRSPSKSRRW